MNLPITIAGMTKEEKDAFRLYNDIVSIFARVEIYSEKSKSMAAEAFKAETSFTYLTNVQFKAAKAILDMLRDTEA